MQRRNFIAATAAALAPNFAIGQDKPKVKIGVDLFSLGAQGWSPFEFLDYCAKLKANVVHFSEIRFLGSLEDAHVKKVGEYAKRLGIELEIGMMSICSSSSRFDPKQGTAEEQLIKMINAARIAGSPLVRSVLGSEADRRSETPMEKHIENTVRALKAVRSRAMDANVKIAVENHAGDMQARELKTLIVEAGRDFVGACIDPGNSVWAIEDPHLTLEVLAPYAITSHIRDSHIWRTPEGVAVSWVRTGEGNVNIGEWIRKFNKLCPDCALTSEIIVMGPRMYNFLDEKFWDGYRKTPAWEFARFLALAEKGKPPAGWDPAAKPRGFGGPRGSNEERAKKQREDLEVSLRYVQDLLGA